MKKISLFILCSIIINVCYGQGNYVATGKIDGDFKIEFLDKNITIEPHNTFNLSSLGLVEYPTTRAPLANGEFGQKHIGAAIVFCFILPWMDPILIHYAVHAATKHKMNNTSYKIAIIKPDGKKYYAKIAFFRVKQKCAMDVGSYYNISIPNNKFSSLENGSISSFSQFEYCGVIVSWVIWDVKAN